MDDMDDMDMGDEANCPMASRHWTPRRPPRIPMPTRITGLLP